MPPRTQGQVPLTLPRSGRTSVMVRGFNVNNNQVNGSGDNLSEQSRPLLQVEDIRAATGSESALLESSDWGYFTVDVPNFWERPEMNGYLRDVRLKPDKYAWLKGASRVLPAPFEAGDSDFDPTIFNLLNTLREDNHDVS